MTGIEPAYNGLQPLTLPLGHIVLSTLSWNRTKYFHLIRVAPFHLAQSVCVERAILGTLSPLDT